MAFFEWEDGQTMQGQYIQIATVTIGLETYPVVVKRVSGNTPLTAENLNYMQTLIKDYIDNLTGVETYEVESTTTDYTISDLGLKNDFKISIDVPITSFISITGVRFNNIANGNYRFIRQFASGSHQTGAIHAQTPSGDANGQANEFTLTSRANGRTAYDLSIKMETGNVSVIFNGGSYGDAVLTISGFGYCTQAINQINTITFTGSIPAGTIIKIYKNR